MVMLRLWINSAGNRATGNELEKVLRHCGREDVVRKCITNLDVIEDKEEIDKAKVTLMKIDDKVGNINLFIHLADSQALPVVITIFHTHAVRLNFQNLAKLSNI